MKMTTKINGFCSENVQAGTRNPRFGSENYSKIKLTVLCAAAEFCAAAQFAHKPDIWIHLRELMFHIIHFSILDLDCPRL